MGSFDISRLNAPPRWVRVGLDDMEVELKHVGPRDQERWRQKMIASGILKKGTAGAEINRGREEQFFRAYAEEFIEGWRNLIVNGQENPDYSAEMMGHVLGQSTTAFNAILEALGDELHFFSRNGNASTGLSTK